MTAGSARPLARSFLPADTSRPVLDLTTGEVLRAAAADSPDEIALIEATPEGEPSLTGAAATDRRVTYRELLEEAEHTARWLLDRFSPGDRITIWAPNVPEWIVVQYGAALAGLVLVTANPALRSTELRYVIEQSGSVGVVHANAFRGTDMAAIAAEVVDELEQVHTRLDLAEWQTAVRDAAVTTTSLPDVRPGDPAQIQYTSGTTGFPKGALLHHRGLVTNAALMIERAQLPVGGTVATAMPLFHTAGCAMSVLGCAHRRATLALCRLFDPGLVLTTLERTGADLVFGVPTMLTALLTHPTFHATDVSTVSVVLSGGSSVPAELVRRAETGFDARFSTVYGQTELSPIVTQTSPDDADAVRAETTGRPLPQVELKIIHPTTGDVVDVGEQGEVCARGYQVMLGYDNSPTTSSETIDADGWLHTGDLGTLDDGGNLRITGRLKDMIIRGGENIYPAEIEHVLYAHPEVRDAAVLGVPDDVWGETVTAVIIPQDPAQPPTWDELHRHCRAALAPHKTPTTWHLATELPLTGSGKVQKFRLLDQLQTIE